MEENCPKCESFADVALPMRYSPVDKFQRFRLKIEEE